MKNLEQQFSENLLVTSRHETQSLSSVREYYSDSIPVDLLIDIFSRLPRKSIDRFRCVSKLWKYILRRPDFTELFLTKSSTRPRLLFTLKVDGKLLFYSLPQPQNPNKNSTLVATRYHTSFPEYIPSGNCTPVCGLVLLEGGYVLLKDKTLPQVKAKSNYPNTAEPRATIGGVYLGYDPISRQFKVLCMTTSVDERPNTHQVLTLESGKRLWRRIERKIPFVETDRTDGDICINGVLYFGSETRTSFVVVCFDVRTEKLGSINIDKDMLGNKKGYVCGELALFNYKGKLGIRKKIEGWHWNRYRDPLVLWVLEDAGNHKWSKHTYELPSLIRGKWFVGMAATGEIVLSSYKNDDRSNLFCVYFYNIVRKDFTTVSIQGFEEFKHVWIDIFLDYVENLKFM
ncbi:unnamed protein product [Microthlaspi erraticum]|uniref:F-box domain-containing protein n=1 Tax=Microthlaspi erraticum TaxID=1685480 RepID=A0A6D2JQW2_9BRAS|nr:unnamed protein product [Microthlaspi erraticum]